MSALLDEPRTEAPGTVEELPTLAAALRRLGSIPAERISLLAPIGGCTEESYLEVMKRKIGLFELIDGTLVEKAMGSKSSYATFDLIGFLAAYLRVHDIAFGFAPDLMVRLGSQIRLPDISICLKSRFPGGKMPEGNIMPAGPDLAIEVMSDSNTAEEMARKRGECFAGGTRLFWEVEPGLRLVRVFTTAEAYTVVSIDGTLEGEPVLPGFRLPLRDLFRS
ncbi:MAG: Uma2 family endonuclease [Gemmataceae bacterium]|nr:Uma2 family endonuclease [Gemmataceae bacterium]